MMIAAQAYRAKGGERSKLMSVLEELTRAGGTAGTENPFRFDAAMLLAEQLAEDNKHADSAKWYDKAVNLARATTERERARMLRNLEWSAAGETDRAITDLQAMVDALRRVEKADPEQLAALAEAEFRLALLVESKDADISQKLLADAYSHAGKTPLGDEIGLAMAERAIAQSDVKSATTIIGQLMRADTASAVKEKADYLRAVVFRKLDQHESLRQHSAQMQTNWPGSIWAERANLLLAESFLQQPMNPDVITWIDNLAGSVRHQENTERLKLVQGYLLIKNGKTDQALKLVRDAANGKSSAEWALLEASVYQKSQRYDEAWSAWRRYLAASGKAPVSNLPAAAEAFANTTATWDAADQRWLEGQATVEQCRWYRELGLALARRNQPDRAIKALEQAMPIAENDNDRARVLLDFARIGKLANRPKLAQQSLEQIANLKVTDHRLKNSYQV